MLRSAALPRSCMGSLGHAAGLVQYQAGKRCDFRVLEGTVVCGVCATWCYHLCFLAWRNNNMQELELSAGLVASLQHTA